MKVEIARVDEETNILLDVMLLLDRPTLSTWGFIVDF